MTPDPLVRAGQRVGKYILGEPIARGGMAEVWAARVEGPRGFVKSLALKFILDSFAGDSELERLFVNEARLAAQLQHANLVSVFDFDKISDPGGQGRYYIAMERIEGHDLRRVLQNLVKRGRRLPPDIALHVAGEVLKGLRYVHERRDPDTQGPLGLVHRDVSPHNILIGLGGEVKLSDFGIAKAMTQSLGTKAGMIRGKLAYASPEQLRGEAFDHRTDQFALGVTLWEALAGQRLFDGTSEMDIIGKVLRCQIPPLGAELGVAPATEAVIRHMLAANPDDRYPSTAEAFTALLACPGYTPDGSALEALMKDLFAPQRLELPPTLPLDGAPGPQQSEDGTKLAREGAGASGTAPAALVAFPGNTTPAIEQPAFGRGPGMAGLGDGVPVPRSDEAALPDSNTFADHERSVTGSAYVSTVDGGPASGRSRRAPRAGAVAAVAVAGIALIGFFGRRAWEGPPPSQDSATIRSAAEPRPIPAPVVFPDEAPAALPARPQALEEPPPARPTPPVTTDEARPALPERAPEPHARAEPAPHDKRPHRPGRTPKPPPVVVSTSPAPPRPVELNGITKPVDKNEIPVVKPPGAPSPAAATTNGSPVLP